MLEELVDSHLELGELVETQEELGELVDSHFELVDTHEELGDVVDSHLELEEVEESHVLEVVFMGQAAARVRNERTETALMEFILSEGYSE